MPSAFSTSNPIGKIEALPVPFSQTPAGYLPCDGRAVLRSQYPALFAAIGTRHGNGTTSTVPVGTLTPGLFFNLPDYRGRFLRAANEGVTRDADAASRTAMATGGISGNQVGTLQADAMQSHEHLVGQNFTSFTNRDAPDDPQALSRTVRLINLTNASATGGLSQPTAAETRPVNAYLNYFIKY